MGLNLLMASGSLNVANRMDAGLNHSPYVLVVERNRLAKSAHASSVQRHGEVVVCNARGVGVVVSSVFAQSH